VKVTAFPLEPSLRADRPQVEHRFVQWSYFRNPAHRWHTTIKMMSAAFVVREPDAGVCLGETMPEGNPIKQNDLGIRYDPGMFSSSVAKTAAFAVASLLR
jgi:hypothetical protein